MSEVSNKHDNKSSTSSPSNTKSCPLALHGCKDNQAVFRKKDV